MTHHLHLRHTTLVLALASVWSAQAFASAGIAQFTTGEVTVRRGAEQIALAKGRAVESGDSIVTGSSGRAQVRFSDGGLVALQPNSQFNISRYADANDPKQDAFLVDLLRGGMRAITGLIGKRNRENYKITTTTATVGIRGSSFNLTYLPDGTLSVAAEQDAIEVCTRAGCTGLTAGESARVVSPDRPAIRTSVRASLPIPTPTRTPSVKSEDVESEGTTAVVPTGNDDDTPTTSRFTVLADMAVASSGIGADGSRDQRKYVDGAVIVDLEGKPRYYLAAGSAAEANTSGTVEVVSATGSLDNGDLMILATSAGNWKTPASTGSTIELSKVGFVTGVVAPTEALSAMRGMRGEYNLAASTPVFSTSGATGTVLSGSKLTVDFVGAGNFVDVDLGLSMPAQGTVAATQYKLSGGVGSRGVGFEGNVQLSSTDCAEGTASCGVGRVAGFFGGLEAQNAGLSFSARGTAHGDLGGAATFVRASSDYTPAEMVFSNAGDPPAGMRFAGAGFVSGSGWFQQPIGGPSASFQFTGSALDQVSSGVAAGATLARTSNPTPDFGALGKPGDADFIGWGKWATGGLTYAGTTGVQHVHYVVGAPTPAVQMPVTGTAQYDMIGGTAPTARAGLTTQTGELLSGSLSANFTAGTAALDLATRFGSTQVNVQNNALSITGSQINSGAAAVTFVNGFFTGNQAARAGLIYGIDHAGMGRITGAVSFQRTSGTTTPIAPER